MSRPSFRKLLSRPSPSQDLFTLLDLKPTDEMGIKSKCDDDAVLAAIRRDPNAVAERFCFKAYHGFRLYPLSGAVFVGASVQVLQELYDIFPDAIQDDHGCGWTPLFGACFFQAPFEVTSFLAEKYPPALEIANGCGYTPLHMAVYRNCSPEVVRVLAEGCPTVLEMTDDQGRTPLTIAKQMYNALGKMKRKNTYPEIIALLTNLHFLLCLDPSDEEVATALLQSSEENTVEIDRPSYAGNRSKPTHIFRVTVPPGIAPGRVFQVYTGPHVVKIKCPRNSWPGQILHITPPPDRVATEDGNHKNRNWIYRRCHRKSHGKSTTDGSTTARWSSQVARILHWRTSVVHKMDIHATLMPNLLERVGQDCMAQTMFQIVRERMDIF